MSLLSFLDKDRSVASPGYSRWLVPPAALAIHLSIGQVYAFSVFKKPMTQLIAGDAPGHGVNWSEPQLQWIFSIAIVILGLSAALFGKWLERAGPRKAMFAAACCFGSGLAVSALGVHLHQLWLVYLGYGGLGGVGLGLGYIAPVSTLIKWFIDRPGMATGLAIMGFGGGAMIGSSLAGDLMAHFKHVAPQGVAPAMLVMGFLYFVFMLFGAFLVRIPAEGWKPPGYDPARQTGGMITTHMVDATVALRTPQFWLLWIVLCLNVTAGIGILEQASIMVRDMFRAGGGSDSRVTIAAATGFVGLLSLFNMVGRFGWSSLSDYIGRKATYMIFFALGAFLFVLLPHVGVNGLNSIPLFVAVCAIIISMYGGGFATIPAYLRDLFGTLNVSAIHGRLLTAWSTAGVLGPFLVNYIGAHEDARGVLRADRYDLTFYIMAALLVAGFFANLLVRPVSSRFYADIDAAKGSPTTPRTPPSVPFTPAPMGK
jgi:MFS family permease